MRIKWIIVIAAIQVVTISYAAKKLSLKEQPIIEVTEAMRAEWNDSLNSIAALAVVDLNKGDSVSAMSHFELVYLLAVKAGNKEELIRSGIYIGKEYVKMGKSKPAEIVLEQVFNTAEQNKRWDIKLEASDLLAQLFSSRAFYVRANFFLKESYALRERASELVKQQQRAKLQAEFDAMVKAKEKEWELKQTVVGKAAIEKDQYANFLLIGIGVLVVIVLALIFRIYQLNKSLFETDKENDLLQYHKKHSVTELERLHRLNDELKKRRTEKLLKV